MREPGRCGGRTSRNIAVQKTSISGNGVRFRPWFCGRVSATKATSARTTSSVINCRHTHGADMEQNQSANPCRHQRAASKRLNSPGTLEEATRGCGGGIVSYHVKQRGRPGRAGLLEFHPDPPEGLPRTSARLAALCAQQLQCVRPGGGGRRRRPVKQPADFLGRRRWRAGWVGRRAPLAAVPRGPGRKPQWARL